MKQQFPKQDFEKNISPPVNDSEKLASSLNNTIHKAMHDLRSPLSVIKPYVDFLKRVDNQEKQEAILNRMKIAVEKMEVVINGFIKYSDLICDANPKAAPVFFKDVFKDVSNELNIQYAHVHREMILQDNTEGLAFPFPPMYFKMIFKILLDNAFKFRSTERTLKIKISATMINNDLLLELRDNGVGFPDSFAFEEAFLPFAKNTNPEKGTGLGLASLKYMVEKNKGEVYGSSSEDGTAFIIKLKPYKIFENSDSTDPLFNNNNIGNPKIVNISRVS